MAPRCAGIFAPMHPRWLPLALCSLIAACGGDPPAKEPAKEGPKPADAAKEPAVDAPEPVVEFDITRDKSGALARAAAALEAIEGFDNEALRELSHHAEEMPSFQRVCKHVVSLRATPDNFEACVKEMEHHMAVIGPDLYADYAACLLGARGVGTLDACDAAELAIEIRLHEKPSGDRLSKETCEAFFAHFRALTSAEAGEQAQLVADVLDEIRDDVLTSCAEQGRTSEIECAMKATSVQDLRGCSGLV